MSNLTTLLLLGIGVISYGIISPFIAINKRKKLRQYGCPRCGHKVVKVSSYTEHIEEEMGVHDSEIGWYSSKSGVVTERDYYKLQCNNCGQIIFNNLGFK